MPGLVPARVAGLYERVLQEPGNTNLVAELAVALADSGERRTPTEVAVDIASTGGPSSLSTLLCPLYLVSAGLSVPKVGVPGRPAGGIDVLGTLPGFRTHLSRQGFDDVMSVVGYAHAVADETWAPADAALFRLRQRQGTQDRPALATASLLAKKLASGVQIAGLDVRISEHGNFGKNFEQARMAARMYCDTADQLGLRSVVFLTDATVPYQPFIGRGEALMAVEMVTSGDCSDAWLSSHARMCQEMADILIELSPVVPRVKPFPAPIAGLASLLDAHLLSQGSSREELNFRLSELSAEGTQGVRAPRDGFMRIDLRKMRDQILSYGGTSHGAGDDRGHGGEYPDRVGIRLLCMPGQPVRRGDALAELRGCPTSPAGVDIGINVADECGPAPCNIIKEVILP